MAKTYLREPILGGRFFLAKQGPRSPWLHKALTPENRKEKQILLQQFVENVQWIGSVLTIWTCPVIS